MPFVKEGQQGQKPKGRPKGAKSKKHIMLQAFLQEIVDDGRADFKKALQGLDPKDKVKAYTDLIEYLLPKMSRVESNLVNPQPININFIPAQPPQLDNVIDITPQIEENESTTSNDDTE